MEWNDDNNYCTHPESEEKNLIFKENIYIQHNYY